MATDPAGTTGRAELIVHVVGNIPPQCSILSPANGATLAAGQTTTFSASCSNADGPPVVNGDVRWLSSVNGSLGVGLTVQNALATNGAHVITVCASDPVDGGLEGCDSANVTVVNNIPPACIIATPANGATVAVGQTTTFSASCSNADGPPVVNGQVRWQSSINGSLGIGLTLQNSLSTVGPHVISVCAADPVDAGLEGCAAVNVTVGNNAAPSATIQSPFNGATFLACRDVNLQCSGFDPEGQLATVRWTDSAGNFIPNAGGFVTWRPSTAGTHVVTCTATDAAGASSSASVSINVDSPFVAITNPGDGDNFTVGDTISFSGNACDSELGNLFGGSLSWTSSRDGFFGSGTNRDFNGLSIGFHVISLTATAGPRTRSNSIQVTIDP